MAVTVPSFAKINIGLRIGAAGQRNDGFHELRTVYQTLALHDDIKVELVKGRTGIELKSNHPRVPLDESNTCWKAAERVLRALKLRTQARIFIHKRLPIEGGLGAASSNAVATMFAIERAAKQRLEPNERLRIAEEIGSDVPLFLVGGTVLGTGRGEQVYPLADLPEVPVVVATPDVGVSTPKAFAAWDAMQNDVGATPASPASNSERRYIDRRLVGRGTAVRGTAAIAAPALTEPAESTTLDVFSREVCAWLTGSSGVPARGGDRAEALLLDLVRTGIENDFERVVFPQFPDIRQVKRVLEREGSAYASLSGSGSTVYGFFTTKRAAEKAAKKLGQEGITAHATVTLSREKYWKALAK